MNRSTVLLLVMGLLLQGVGQAEVCLTQSQMTATERDGLKLAAAVMAAQVQGNDAAGLHGATVAELARDFSAVQSVVEETSGKLKGSSLTVMQVYLLDGTQLKRGADGSAPDAQFFCTLNKSAVEVDFLIPSLPPGRYGFAIVENAGGTTPMEVSLLMRQEQGKWELAGLYPKETTAAGHDGVWYWRQAREMAKAKEPWNAWLYYLQAAVLLRPVSFIQSSNFEKLQAEQTSAAPPALSEGVSPQAPLVVKGVDGAEYHFVGLGVDNSLGKDKIDVVAHLKVDQIGDAVTARKRNEDAMRALLAAYPEMRKAFHGVWIFAEVAGQNPFPSEGAMSDIH